MSDPSALERDETDSLSDQGDLVSAELLVIEQGPRVLAIEAHAVDSVVPWSVPAPLPRTSQVVLGVVQDRGRLVAVRRPEGFVESAQRIVLCVTGRGLVGIPATNTRSVGMVRLRGPVRYGEEVESDQGTLTILDPEAVAEEMTRE
jgi:chemotaxis signal transduction protein